MAETRKKSKVYAVVQASVGTYGYGHVTIHVYELPGFYPATLKISCQAGNGTPREEHSGSVESYAWEYGLSHDYSIVNLNMARAGYLLLRALNKKMNKAYEELGSPRNFADFAVRVLKAARVPVVRMNMTVNGGYTSVEALPGLSPARQAARLYSELEGLERQIIEKTK